ncbi:MAG: MFS transporter [Candidatus Bathyarchaeia archaeon]
MTPPLLGYLVFAMFRLSIGVIIPEVMREYQVEEAMGGLTLSSLLGAMALMTVLGGHVSDRVGKKKAMASGLTLMACGILLGGYPTGYVGLLSSMFVTGAGSGAFTAALFAFAGDIMPKSRGSLVGLTNSFYALGGLVGPWLSSILIASINWRFPFYLMGAMALATSTPLWINSRSERSLKTAGERVKVGYAELFRKIHRNRSILLVCGGMGVANFAFVAFTAWAPSYLMKIGGLSLPETGLSFGLYSLSGATGAAFFGAFSDRFTRRKSVMVSGILTSTLLLLYLSGLVRAWSLIGLSIALGFPAFAYWNLTISSAQDQVDEEFIGTVTGMIQGVGLITGMVAPALSGFLITRYGLSSALILSTTLPTIVYVAVTSKVAK